MAFFDLPPDEELSAEVRQLLEEHRRSIGNDSVPRSWRVFARSPEIIEARRKASQNLSFPSWVPWDARNLAVMLIAHAKGCQDCFAYSRSQLERLGFAGTVLDEICGNPEILPLKERDRMFVYYAIKIATHSANLQPKDFREMAEHGFSKEEIQEIIGFAAYWAMTMVFTQSANAALAEE
jgi:alkylhydroperoxidase family enzyme